MSWNIQQHSNTCLKSVRWRKIVTQVTKHTEETCILDSEVRMRTWQSCAYWIGRRKCTEPLLPGLWEMGKGWQSLSKSVLSWARVAFAAGYRANLTCFGWPSRSSKMQLKHPSYPSEDLNGSWPVWYNWLGNIPQSKRLLVWFLVWEATDLLDSFRWNSKSKEFANARAGKNNNKSTAYTGLTKMFTSA